MLNEGWKPIGGVAFNSGFPYQAMARVVSVKSEKKEASEKESSKPLGAQDAMRLIDELT